jgi:UDP-N-acetylglucosamine 4-epimerase
MARTVTPYERLQEELRASPRRWLVTGAAGFIGSALVSKLLELGQEVVGLDNFATGHQRNLDDVLAGASAPSRERFRFIRGDIRELASCAAAAAGADYVLHQAALGSVPRSISDPATTHAANVDGTFNMLVAARDAKVRRFVYASSSSVYGDDPTLPKVEARTGRPLSPYAATKAVDELYADIFQRCYGLEVAGLRYFNVFGPRQDPNGAYAAVIPRWIAALLHDEACQIHGDGETSRDFCYVENAVQANLLAACATSAETVGAVFNVACGDRTSLRDLYSMIRARVAALPGHGAAAGREPQMQPFRAGDIRHSQADISQAVRLLGYAPTHWIHDAMGPTVEWFARDLSS